MSLLLLFKNFIGGNTAPVVTTDLVNAVTKVSARGFGTVTSDGGATILERGFVISTSTNPTTADTKFVVSGTTGAFNALLTSLSANTTYYIRAFARNSVGTSYGANISILTGAGITKKYYVYRIFTGTTYVTTWTKEVISEPSFRSVINGGPGELIVKLGRKFDDFGEEEDVKLNNKVECYVIDEDSPNGMLLYTGYISGYKPVIDEVTEYIEITLLGYVSEFQRMILRDGSGNTTIAYNSYAPEDILKDVMDKYRALGGSVYYTSTSIDKTNTLVSYTFNTNTIKECVDKIIELCPVGWYWRVDPNNVIYLKPKNVMSDHIFTLGLNVEKLQTYRRVEDIVNRVLFTGGGSPPLFIMRENTSSQTSYGLYEKKVIDQRVTLTATAQTIADREIDSKKDPEIRSKYVIIDGNGPGMFGYDIESIKPGQSLSIRNLKIGQKTTTLWDVAFWDTDLWDQSLASLAADIIQIVSINYEPDSIEIEASSRLPQIAKRVEDIQRNLENTQTVNNPTAPS